MMLSFVLCGGMQQGNEELRSDRADVMREIENQKPVSLENRLKFPIFEIPVSSKDDLERYGRLVSCSQRLSSL